MSQYWLTWPLLSPAYVSGQSEMSNSLTSKHSSSGNSQSVFWLGNLRIHPTEDLTLLFLGAIIWVQLKSLPSLSLLTLGIQQISLQSPIDELLAISYSTSDECFCLSRDIDFSSIDLASDFDFLYFSFIQGLNCSLSKPEDLALLQD